VIQKAEMRRERRLRLNTLLIVCLLLVGVVPVAVLTLWPMSRPLEHEIGHVAEKHLLVARHIRASLIRYQRDLKAAINIVATETADRWPVARVNQRTTALLRNLHINRVCMIGRLGAGAITALTGSCPTETSSRLSVLARRLATTNTFRFSHVMRGVDGRPVLHLARRDGDRLLIATLDTTFIQRMQKNVYFGQGGHAAIVDHTGRVLAHPKPAWVQSRKSIAKVKPVQSMGQGKTGVTQFWSPAAKKTMIAGFTAVPGANWGVMVPQPFSELQAKATAIREQILIVALVGIFIALILGVLITRLITRPVVAVAEAVRRMAGGEAHVRVGRTRSHWAPLELGNLATGFNVMAATIDRSKIELENKVARRTQALTHSHTKLMEALDRANAASKTKTAFLAQMSHELRTPLNAILGYSEMMEREVMGPIEVPAYREYLSHIHDSGTLLRDLISDILDTTKLEDGSLALSEHAVSLKAVLDRSLVQTRPMALQHDVTLRSLYGSGLPTVYADETRLLQIVSNLVVNAIKFSEPGGNVMISAGVRRAGTVAVVIRDNGIGMSAADLARIAEPFHQGARNSLTPVEGAGLGVTISLALAKLHGGTIRYRSALGVGTIAEFCLPASRIVDESGPSKAPAQDFEYRSAVDRIRLPAQR